MIRLIYAAGSLAASAAIVLGAGSPAAPVRNEAPASAPNDKPMFLGRMVVTAKPLSLGEKP